MSPSSARPVFTSYDNFSDLGVHLTRSQRPLSFVASRIDYRNTVLAGVPKATTNKLQRALNAAACVVSGRPTYKFDRGLSQLLHTLAGCSLASRVQALDRRHDVQLPARSSASVRHGIVPSIRRCRIAATSPIPTRQLLVIPNIVGSYLLYLLTQ